MANTADDILAKYGLTKTGERTSMPPTYGKKKNQVYDRNGGDIPTNSEATDILKKYGIDNIGGTMPEEGNAYLDALNSVTGKDGLTIAQRTQQELAKAQRMTNIPGNGTDSGRLKTVKEINLEDSLANTFNHGQDIYSGKKLNAEENTTLDSLMPWTRGRYDYVPDEQGRPAAANIPAEVQSDAELADSIFGGGTTPQSPAATAPLAQGSQEADTGMRGAGLRKTQPDVNTGLNRGRLNNALDWKSGKAATAAEVQNDAELAGEVFAGTTPQSPAAQGSAELDGLKQKEADTGMAYWSLVSDPMADPDKVNAAYKAWQDAQVDVALYDPSWIEEKYQAGMSGAVSQEELTKQITELKQQQAGLEQMIKQANLRGDTKWADTYREYKKVVDDQIKELQKSVDDYRPETRLTDVEERAISRLTSEATERCDAKLTELADLCGVSTKKLCEAMDSFGNDFAMLLSVLSNEDRKKAKNILSGITDEAKLLNKYATIAGNDSDTMLEAIGDSFVGGINSVVGSTIGFEAWLQETDAMIYKLFGKDETSESFMKNATGMYESANEYLTKSNELVQKAKQNAGKMQEIVSDLVENGTEMLPDIMINAFAGGIAATASKEAASVIMAISQRLALGAMGVRVFGRTNTDLIDFGENGKVQFDENGNIIGKVTAYDAAGNPVSNNVSWWQRSFASSVSTGVEVYSEKMFRGFGGVYGNGLVKAGKAAAGDVAEKELFDLFQEQLLASVSNVTVKPALAAILSIGFGGLGEGLEEVFSSVAEVPTNLITMDKETWCAQYGIEESNGWIADLLKAEWNNKEETGYSMLIGSLMGMIGQVGEASNAYYGEKAANYMAAAEKVNSFLNGEAKLSEVITDEARDLFAQQGITDDADIDAIGDDFLNDMKEAATEMGVEVPESETAEETTATPQSAEPTAPLAQGSQGEQQTEADAIKAEVAQELRDNFGRQNETPQDVIPKRAAPAQTPGEVFAEERQVESESTPSVSEADSSPRPGAAVEATPQSAEPTAPLAQGSRGTSSVAEATASPQGEAIETEMPEAPTELPTVERTADLSQMGVEELDFKLQDELGVNGGTVGKYEVNYFPSGRGYSTVSVVDKETGELHTSNVRNGMQTNAAAKLIYNNERSLEKYGDKVHSGNRGRTASESGQRGTAPVQRNAAAQSQYDIAKRRQDRAKERAENGTDYASKTARELAGPDGLESTENRVIPEEDYDDELRAIDEDIFNKTKKHPTFVLGQIQIDCGDGVIGYTSGVHSSSGIVVMADSRDKSATQLAEHEYFHDLVEKGKVDVGDMLNELVGDTISQEELDTLRQVYEDHYGQIYGYSEKASALAMEELCADLYAGISGRNGAKITDTAMNTAKDYVSGTGKYGSSQQAQNVQEDTGPPADSETELKPVGMDRLNKSEAEGEQVDVKEMATRVKAADRSMFPANDFTSREEAAPNLLDMVENKLKPIGLERLNQNEEFTEEKSPDLKTMGRKAADIADDFDEKAFKDKRGDNIDGEIINDPEYDSTIEKIVRGKLTENEGYEYLAKRAVAIEKLNEAFANEHSLDKKDPVAEYFDLNYELWDNYYNQARNGTNAAELVKAMEAEYYGANPKTEEIPTKAETEKAEEQLLTALRLPVEKSNAEALMIGLRSGKLQSSMITFSGGVDGFNTHQREVLADELIKGVRSTKGVIKVSVPYDGTFEINNNTEAVASVLTKLGVKVTQEAEINKSIGAWLRDSAKKGRIAVSNVDGQHYVIAGPTAIAISQGAAEHILNDSEYHAESNNDERRVCRHLLADTAKEIVSAEQTSTTGKGAEKVYIVKNTEGIARMFSKKAVDMLDGTGVKLLLNDNSVAIKAINPDGSVKGFALGYRQNGDNLQDRVPAKLKTFKEVKESKTPKKSKAKQTEKPVEAVKLPEPEQTTAKAENKPTSLPEPEQTTAKAENKPTSLPEPERPTAETEIKATSLPKVDYGAAQEIIDTYIEKGVAGRDTVKKIIAGMTEAQLTEARNTIEGYEGLNKILKKSTLNDIDEQLAKLDVQKTIEKLDASKELMSIVMDNNDENTVKKIKDGVKALDDSRLKAAYDEVKGIEKLGNSKPADLMILQNELKNEIDLRKQKADNARKTAEKKTTKKTAGAKSDRLEDFGEKIGGARKDLWSKRGLDITDLEAMNEAERGKYVKKDSVWPKVDYQELVDNGTEREAAYLIKKIRDALPTAPQAMYNDAKNGISVEQRQEEFIEFTKQFRNGLANVKTVEDFQGFIDDVLVKNGWAKRNTDYRGRPDISYVRSMGMSEINLNGDIIAAARLAMFPKELAYEMEKKQFLVAKDMKIPAGYSVELWDGSGWSRSGIQPGTYYAAKGHLIIQTGFETKEAAIKYLQELAASKKKSGKSKFVPPQLENIHRTGRDVRNNNTKHIDGDDMMSTFNFRGGEFGNWNNAKDRQTSMDYAYDALTDLADLLGIDPADISLGGQLAIAFGSRGIAGAAAHYEPDRAVINLTKMNGAGTLAHEWAHALDNLIGIRLGANKYMTEETYKVKLKSLKKLVDGMKYKASSTETAKAAAEKDLKKYRERVRAWISGEFSGRFQQNATQSQMDRLNALLDEAMNGMATPSSETGVVAQLADLRKEVTGRTIPKETRQDLATYLYQIDRKIKSLEDPQGTEMTEFYKNSKRFNDLHTKEDKGYWSSDIEMFARAFACYIHDKAAANDTISDYLNGHSEAAVDLDVDKDGKPVIIKAIPQGEERAFLNQCFDELIAELKEKGMLHVPENEPETYSVAKYSLDEVENTAKYSPDEEYESLAENPEKNEERLNELVSQAAERAGYTQLMYHGSKSGGGFNTFRDWTYFTESEKYAKRYTQDHQGKGLYTVYVKMEKPFDTRKPKEKRIFKNAVQELGLTQLQENGLPDWTDGYDLSDYIDENGLDYDAILLDEGGDMIDGKPVSRGISYVIRKSAQIKSADTVTYDDSGNVIPLSERFNDKSNDIRYSLDEVSESTEDKPGANLDWWENYRQSFIKHNDRDEFRGTANLAQLGINIAGNEGIYDRIESLKNSIKALRSVKAATTAAEKRVKASYAEMTFAKDIASGIYTEADIPSTFNVNKVTELADFYFAEQGASDKLMKKQKALVNKKLDQKMYLLMGEGKVKKLPKSYKLNFRTPLRSMREMFGDKAGQEIYDTIFAPVEANTAERDRFRQRMYNAVEKFTGEDGKQSKLNKQESALVMAMVENEQAAILVKEMETGTAVDKRQATAIKDAVKNIQNGQSIGDALKEWQTDERTKRTVNQLVKWEEAQKLIKDQKLDTVKLENAAKTYQAQFAAFYDAINDLLAAHGYEPIGFIKGYAPHMQEEHVQTALQDAMEFFGLTEDVTNLPTEIAGMTANFRPNKRWNPYFLQRNGEAAKQDIVAAYESYVDYMSDVIYHMDDIMRVRAFERYFRETYSDDNVRDRIEEAKTAAEGTLEQKIKFLRDIDKVGPGGIEDETIVDNMIEEYIEKMYQQFKEHSVHGPLVTWLTDYANNLAAKQLSFDRGGETFLGRKYLNVSNKLTQAFATSQVGGKLSSVLNQGAQLPMIYAELGGKYTARAMKDFMFGRLKSGGWSAQSDFLVTKMGVDSINPTLADMVVDKMFIGAEFVDSMMSTLAVRGRYLKGLDEGLSHKDAMKAADRFGSDIMGSRAKGTKPLAFASKDPIKRMLTMFQIEALNSWDHVISDLPHDFREIEEKYGRAKAASALAGVILKSLIASFLMNRLDDEIYGGTPAPFDLLGLSANFVASGNGLRTNDLMAIMVNNMWKRATGEELFEGIDDSKMSDGKFNTTAAFKELGENVVNDVPLVRNIASLLGWGDSTLPFAGSGVNALVDKLMGEKDGKSWAETLRAFALGYVPGGSQIERTIQGAEALREGGVYSSSGKLKYALDNQDPWTIARVLAFGKYANPEAQRYYADIDFSGKTGNALSETQQKAYNLATEAGMRNTNAEQMIRSVWSSAKELSVDKDGKQASSINQTGATAALDAMDIPKELKAVLWQCFNKTWKGTNNPYSTKIGTQVYEAFQAGETPDLSGLSLPGLD